MQKSFLLRSGWICRGLRIYTVRLTSNYLCHVLQHLGGCGKGLWEPLLMAEGEISYIDENPCSDFLIMQIRQWLTSCVDTHENCRSDSAAHLPLRVIDTGSSDDQDLLILSVGRERPGRYTALSYRWGTQNTLGIVTTSTNITRRMTIGFSKMSLSRTIQDAIKMTRILGLRYLWVDAICIIQDSEGDWESQAADMCNIYSGAFVCLSVDKAVDDDAGFLERRNLQEIRGCRHPSLWSDNRWIIPSLPDPGRTLDNSILSRRGWILQERVFPCRIIHWTAYEIIWECFTEILSERWPYTRLGSEHPWPGIQKWANFRYEVQCRTMSTVGTPIEPPSLVRPFFDWYRILEDYTTRNLSRQLDKLPALSGLARLVFANQAGRSTYIAGLWTHDIPKGLLWSRKRIDPSSQSPTKQLASSDVREYQAPSFSWAALNCPVHWSSNEWRGVNSMDDGPAKLVDYQTDLAGEDPFGKVRGGWIKLEACVIPTMRLVKAIGPLNPEYFLRVELDEPQGELETIPAGATIVLIHVTSPVDEWLSRELGCRVYDNRFHCLILMKQIHEQGLYRRIGLLSYTERVEGTAYSKFTDFGPFKEFGELERTVVTII